MMKLSVINVFSWPFAANPDAESTLSLVSRGKAQGLIEKVV